MEQRNGPRHLALSYWPLILMRTTPRGRKPRPVPFAARASRLGAGGPPAAPASHSTLASRPQAYLSGIVLVGVPALWIALSPKDVKVAPASRETLVGLPVSFDADMINLFPAATTTEATG